MKRVTVPKIVAQKKTLEKIVMLTCYDATFASLLDKAGVDILLVGDSLGMVIQGRPNTLSVTLEDVLYHTKCVSSLTEEALVVADLPFMSYQVSKEEALKNAGRLLKEAGAEAVKLEGGREQHQTIHALVEAGIPVMGHIGLKPQSIHKMGGYKIQGKTENSVKELIQDARALEEAGCFAIVLEGIKPAAAKEITQKTNVPTVGIASGPDCDGQVLVLYDLLGLHPGWQPKFAKKYMDGNTLVSNAAKQFIKEVQQGIYPPTEEDKSAKEQLRLVQ